MEKKIKRGKLSDSRFGIRGSLVQFQGFCSRGR